MQWVSLVNFLSHGPRPHRAASLCCALCNPFSNFPISTKTQTGQAKLSGDIRSHGFVQILWIFSTQSPFLIFSQPPSVSFPSGRNTNQSWGTNWIKQVPPITALWTQQAVTEPQRRKMSFFFNKEHGFALTSSKSLSMSIKIQPAHGNSVLNKADQVQTEQKKLLPCHRSSPEVAAAHFPWDTGSNWKPKGQAS